MSLFLSFSLYLCWSVHACLAPSTGSPSLTCTPNWFPLGQTAHKEGCQLDLVFTPLNLSPLCERKISLPIFFMEYKTQNIAKCCIFIFKIENCWNETIWTLRCVSEVFQLPNSLKLFSCIRPIREKNNVPQKILLWHRDKGKPRGALLVQPPNSPPSSSARVMFMWVNRGCQANISTYFSPAKQQKLFVFLNCRICDNMLWANSLNKTRRRNNICLTSTTLYFNKSDYSL